MKDTGLHVQDEMLPHWSENEARLLEVTSSVNTAKIIRLSRERLHAIKTAAARISSWAEKNRHIPQEFEWLLDNRYLIEREGNEAIRQIQKTGRLPSAQGMPAVYILASALARSGRGEITAERISIFLENVQRVRIFSEKELWLFVPMLRLSLVELAGALSREMEDMLGAFRRPASRDPFAAEAALWKAREDGRPVPEGAADLAQGAQATHTRLAGLMREVVTSMRTLSVTDLSGTLRKASVVEELLGGDPAGVYSDMDEESRAQYRQELSRLAKRRNLPEHELAEEILSICRNESTPKKRHVGYYLRTSKEQRVSGAVYFGVFGILSLLLAITASILTGKLWTGILLLLPAADMAKNITDYIASKLVRPRAIARLELKDGIPVKTLCVISALLTDTQSAITYVKKLEAYRFANQDAGGNLHFGILADLPDSKVKLKNGDKRIIEEVQKGIFELNKKYGGGYYLFLRDRELNLRDNMFMGWERKRGALLELMRLLKGERTGLRVATGNKKALEGTKYLITLDGDTALVPGSARALVGGMLHPMSTPVIDTKRNIVTEGYGLILPRMAVDLEQAGRSMFSRIYAGQGGIDPYGGLAGDIYHDIFDQASYTGKGILDIDVCYKILEKRFPQNRILSHDLLEGSYVRAGLMGDLELTDGYPCKVSAWFDRLERWTRGDWQIASWIFPKVKTDGGKENNPISRLSKWKIFDNLRRSITPVALLAAITMGLVFSQRTFAIAGGAAILYALSNLILSAAELAARGGVGGGIKLHSTIITGYRAILWQTVLQLLFLPYHAFISVHAIVTALYRLNISKKYLLRWVTAAQSEKYTQSSITAFRKQFIAVIWGVLTACFARGSLGWLWGVAWALSPLLSAYISRTEEKGDVLVDSDRAFLTRQAALMWEYFEDFLTPEDHFLPPDNWQEQPAVGIARRTSPTNIGLALICALSAADLNLISPERALSLIRHMLDTVENLPKWNGHLYNWYDTRTLEPLRPCCVSSVDSGNMVGYLIALKEGLEEERFFNDEALAETAGALAKRATKLAEEMNFKCLYNSDRKLFAIGYDMEKNCLTEGYYDLLGSEARQTSYITVARGEVDRKHWRRLGRSLAKDGSYRGLASWTGTMFEYFMPHILLPIYKNSLLYESLCFALYGQRRRADEHNIPWGTSESCFYAFDAALTYQYKAHGIPSMAFKRGLGKEMVISPYSSFLALMINPEIAVKNLRRLYDLGFEGKYGFFEAGDFTPSRQSGTKGFEMVKCFMSHHIGMSIAAICNTLRGNIWQKRFLRNAAMGAYTSLLQERVPAHPSTIRPVGREIPEKPKRAVPESIRREMQMINPLFPRGHLLSNSSYVLLCSDTGLSSARCGSIALTRCDNEISGMGFFLSIPDDKIETVKNVKDSASLLSLLPAMENMKDYKAIFEGGGAIWEYKGNDIQSKVCVSIPENENAEFRTVSIKNTGVNEIIGEIICYFEPVLRPYEDFSVHPAFSKLFLETSRIENGILVRRRPHGGKGEGYLAFCCNKEEAQYDTSREEVFGRGGILNFKRASKCKNTIGAVLDPCVLVRVPVKIQAGQSQEISFSLAYAEGGNDAIDAAGRTLKLLSHQTPSGRIDGAIRLLGLTQAEAIEALDMITPLTLKTPPIPPELEKYLYLGQSGLWKFGISGDLPIIGAKAFEPAQIERLGRIVRKHMFLTYCGLKNDLVILSRDGGDYRKPVRSAISEILKALNCENSLGARGGVHIVDLSSISADEEGLLTAHMCVTDESENYERSEYKAEKTLPLPAPEVHTKRHLEYNWLPDGAFSFETGGRLPPLAWSHVLSNGAYGALMTECGTGFMWRRNARENKMLPWKNDPLATEGPESIRIRFNGTEMSLFAAEDNLPCRVTYGYGYAIWEKRSGGATVTTTAFVPPYRSARVLIVEIQGVKEAQIVYRAQLALGVKENRFVSISQDPSGLLRAENHYSKGYNPQSFVMAASVPPIWKKGNDNGVMEAYVSPVRRNGKLRAVVVTGCAQNTPGLELLRGLADDREAGIALTKTVEYWSKLVRPLKFCTSDESLNHYLNGWALYQVIACRLYARTSQYQCGGAYGFRDQLQDSCAALYAWPHLTKTQILRACVHQYEEGDGQHWWHPSQLAPGEGDKGVRTRCSDDLLWLPYTVCEYLEKTGDRSILSIECPYITSAPLKPGAHDRYESPRRTDYRACVYEHCVKAVDLVLHRGMGVHGLPLMGSGDWNDGFNLVGDKGKGESVWLCWFLAKVLEKMAPVCAERGDTARADHYMVWHGKLLLAGAGAWDGRWFRRGYYDNGNTLGSIHDEECKIDSLSQSWAAFFANKLPEGYVESGLKSAWEMLVDSHAGVVRLFTPPFSHSAADPGYIKGYIPGVRENGGQYTHAAVWLAMGCFLADHESEGEQLLKMLLPENHDPEIYKAEPYVLAADVYYNGEKDGRGGWSHYTGAASWFWRVAVEYLLKTKLENGIYHCNKKEVFPNRPNGCIIERI